MSPQRRQRVEEIYRAALERAAEFRSAFLDGACGRDAELRREVESLLAQAEPAATAIESRTVTATMPFGQEIGPYRILSPLGAGGMGEVYRAHDNKLGRDVALKMLPKEFALDPERLARFQREARMLASLNHPNIGAIYGLEESGGATCLVLELVEGEALRGPLPIDKALEYARQVAEALEAAHQKGIIHRDLKPANVKVTPEGRVKVLDFGVAKAVWGTVPGKDLSQVETVAQLESVAGHFVGTPPYMSPEQALGNEVDRRTDVWAFGCLLYELLTGKRAFGRSTLADTVAAIMGGEPDWEELPPATPASVRRLLRKCLEKDAARRLKDILSARTEIEQASLASKPTGKRRTWIATAAAVALAAGVALYLRSLARVQERPNAPLKHVSFTQLTDQPGQEVYPSLSPDLKSFVYASRASGNWDIYAQRVGGRNGVNLTVDSPADDTTPAFSPNGQQIAFRSERDGGGIFVMEATGENVRRVADFGYNPAWSPDGHEIVCASSTSDLRHQLPSQLFRVNVSTGQKRLITPEPDYAMQPHWSPHGYRIAYWRVTGGHPDIWTLREDGSNPVAVTKDDAFDWDPVWSPDGAYLYFASNRGGSMNLWRVRIDERSGKILGDLEPVTTPSPYSGYISFSSTGRQMAYVQQSQTSNIYRVGFDPVRETTVGRPVPVTQGSRYAQAPDVSPDGQWLVFVNPAKGENLFLSRTDGTGLRQLTTGAFRDRVPMWSPDGKRVAFYSNRSGKFDVWTIRPDGSGLEQLTFTPEGFVVYPVWSPDSSRMVYTIQNRTPFLMELDRPWRSQSPQALPTLAEPGAWFAAFRWSPDGRSLVGFRVRGDGNFTGIDVYSFDTKKYDHLTPFGWFPRWLSDSRRVLFHNENDSKSYLVDSRTRKFHEVFSAAPNAGGPLVPAPDDRWMYFTLNVTESDIWLADLE
jgi:serine/threonine protein kinase